MENINTPFDFLNSLKGKKVEIKKFNGEIVEGTLKAFDLNINIGVVIEGKLRFVPGCNVSHISLVEE